MGKVRRYELASLARQAAIVTREAEVIHGRRLCCVRRFQRVFL